MHHSRDIETLRPLDRIPAPRIGILGGGQLAKMTATAAANFGCEVVVLERSGDFPAHSVDAHALIGDWNDPREALRLAKLVDVVALENEFVDVAALDALENNGHKLWPSSETIKLVQDKFRQKQVFMGAGLPVARFAAVASPADVRHFGLPAVLKKRLNSYDGKGNATVRGDADLASGWAKLDGDQNGLYAEDLCDFTAELAIIITRGQRGEIARYPVVETINREHICHITKAPAQIPSDLARAAGDIAERAIKAMNGVGTFGVEMFLLRDGRLLVNEVAPRVHNTGHYTIEAAVCSQFENHVRALLGWPLGSTLMVAPAAVMVNLLGYADGTGIAHGLADALRVPGAHVHIYGKTRSARGRKMGHVTALGNTMAEALSTAQRAADCIRFGGDE